MLDFFFKIFIEIQLIYNAVLVSGYSKVNQLYIYQFFFILFSYKLLKNIE